MKPNQLSKALSALTVFAVVTLGAGAASADYVCSVSMTPAPSSAGPDGYVSFSLYTAPGCSGSYVRTGYLCSPGASSPSCTNYVYYLYDKSQLLAVFDSLVEASRTGHYVTSYTSGCNGGGTGCATRVNFFAY